MLTPLIIEDRPHWHHLYDPVIWPVFDQFQLFLTLVWDHLGLPEPTNAQMEIAHRLQFGADSVEWNNLDKSQQDALLCTPREDIIRAFRGIGKSYITASFVIWLLARNPRDEKILVLSATGSKAREFVDQVKGILQTMPLLSWLMEGDRLGGAKRRDHMDRFDVSGASNAQSFSVKASGITGQITGSRATTLISDDIEIEKNSHTSMARNRILNIVRAEFGPITRTESGKGDVVMLGTPQTTESIYNILVQEMGYRCFTVPARFPEAARLDHYRLKLTNGLDLDILAPYLRSLHDNGTLGHMDPTDSRFTNKELDMAEAKGRSAFALHYMLDTTLTDAERYPLKQQDFILLDTDPFKAPLSLKWGCKSDRSNCADEIPSLAFSGDQLLRPLTVDKQLYPYEGSVLFVDPAGRGKDETAWAIVKSLNGFLYLLKSMGYAGDPSEAMKRIARDAKAFQVNVVEVEPNYGQGMWVTAFKPVLHQLWPGGCTIQESQWARGQKETRIIDTLEPALSQHRLVLSTEVARQDSQSQDRRYALLYQMTHITRDRNALAHDDRLEALAGGVAYFQRALESDTSLAKEAYLESIWDQEVEDIQESLRNPGIRGRRIDGHRQRIWQSKSSALR
ncbi:MAG: phage terminase large subunit [Magnetococcales bacterium]|nr:phage terminase large subunit [Magnetococcales bacterium]